MALTLQADIEGQLPNSKTTLYTCPGATTAFVKSFQFVNTDAGAITMNFYFKKSAGTSRRICPVNLSLATGEAFMSEDGDEIFLEAGDVLEGDASTASVIDYHISVMERT